MTQTQLSEEISTIFVVGFPDDMQEREFQNMFCFAPGFEAATLKVPLPNEGEEGRKQTIGFAKFRTRAEALEAREILSGRKVDADKGNILKAEMAKKNLHTKRGLSADTQSQPNTPSSTSSTTKRIPPLTPPKHYDPFYSLPSDLLPPPDFDVFSDSFLRSSNTIKKCLDDEPVYLSRSQSAPIAKKAWERFAPLNLHTTMPSAPQPVQTPPPLYARLPIPANPADQNPPCNTLYVGNLPHSASEDELRQLFSACRGYKRMCFRTKANGPMCFVEFETIDYAARALAELQGRPLSSSMKGGIRLSFSKNPLGMRQQQSPTQQGQVATGFLTDLQTSKMLPVALPFISDRREGFLFDPQL
ncbi:uncharacterized protein VTP21DRAFT_1281 [Calcarisporiella thermophila]|uniref:uncharacterized protein n=1 Tax=Calcarisporiella thermophila TaxID=911321 RepID=UPI0037441E52